MGAFKSDLPLLATVSQSYWDFWETGYHDLRVIPQNRQKLGVFIHNSVVIGLGLFLGVVNSGTHWPEKALRQSSTNTITRHRCVGIW